MDLSSTNFENITFDDFSLMKIIIIFIVREKEKNKPQTKKRRTQGL